MSRRPIVKLPSFKVSRTRILKSAVDAVKPTDESKPLPTQAGIRVRKAGGKKSF